MANYQLSNGREIYLVRLAIVQTYAEAFEGTEEALRPHVLAQAPERAARLLPPSKPLVVIAPRSAKLPNWMCVAELGSRSGVQHSDPDFNSILYACWFASDTAVGVNDMIQGILPKLDWENVAEDYDMTFI